MWGRLDEQCGWREFAAGAAAEPVATAVVAFEPQSVLGVDWHALGAWRGLRQRLGGAAAALPYIYLNYRCVFAIQSAPGIASSTAFSAACMAQALQPMLHCLFPSKPHVRGHVRGVATHITLPHHAIALIVACLLPYSVYCRTAAGEAHALLRQLEREAVEAAAATVCLSRSDAAYIREHLQPGPGAAPPQVGSAWPSQASHVLVDLSGWLGSEGRSCAGMEERVSSSPQLM